MTTILRKSLIAGGIAALVSLGTIAPASAGDGGAIAGGVLGGLALGAIAGSAANGYYARPAYAPGPYYGGGCYFERRPVYDEYGQMIGRRRVRVCE